MIGDKNYYIQVCQKQKDIIEIANQKIELIRGIAQNGWCPTNCPRIRENMKAHNGDGCGLDICLDTIYKITTED